MVQREAGRARPERHQLRQQPEGRQGLAYRVLRSMVRTLHPLRTHLHQRREGPAPPPEGQQKEHQERRPRGQRGQGRRRQGAGALQPVQRGELPELLPGRRVDGQGVQRGEESRWTRQ
ncbi:hypothetical protein THAOC_26456, partial [Thalassiosira oceanica]